MTEPYKDPDKIYAVPESEGGATGEMSKTRIPHKEITERDGHATAKRTSGSGCGVTAACLAGFLFIVAAALVLRVM
jgi:hypothetical protein